MTTAQRQGPQRTLDEGLVPGAGDDLEGPVFHVSLDWRVGKAAPDEALGIKHRVVGVEGDLEKEGSRQG